MPRSDTPPPPGRTAPPCVRIRLDAVLAQAAAIGLALLLPGAAEAQTRPRGQPAPAPVIEAPLPAPAPPPPAVLAPLPPPAPLQRRISLAELGLAAGAAFGADPAEVSIPLPRGLPAGPARLGLALDGPARGVAEVTANGRLLGTVALPGGGSAVQVEAALDAADLARQPDALRLGLRLLEGAGPARLRPESHLGLLLDDSAPPPVAAMHRLLPRQVVVALRRGALPAEEAAAALRLGLALAALGREVRFAAAPPEPAVREDGPRDRVWEGGVVLLGTPAPGATVTWPGGAPVLGLGTPVAGTVAQLLDGPWRGAAPPPARDALTLDRLRGALPPQGGIAPAWSLEVSARDLPPGTALRALDLEIRAPGPGRTVATVLFNETLLGAAALPATGRARLSLAIPERLVGLDNRIAVMLRRDRPGEPAEILAAGSALRLGPAGPVREFHALPPAFATGVEVILDAPGGALAAEALNLPFWVLRGLVPAGAPLTLVLQEPGHAPRPRGPWIALTREPPAGTTPPLPPGPARLEDRRGAALLDEAAAARMLPAQLLAAEAPGLWLRAPASRAAFPAPAGPPPRLDRGDVALLDPRGVALAWSSGPAALVAVRTAPPDAPAAGPWWEIGVGSAWLVAVLGVLVAHARRPRMRPA